MLKRLSPLACHGEHRNIAPVASSSFLMPCLHLVCAVQVLKKKFDDIFAATKYTKAS